MLLRCPFYMISISTYKVARIRISVTLNFYHISNTQFLVHMHKFPTENNLSIIAVQDARGFMAMF